MTIQELLEELEGDGLIVTDWEQLIESLSYLGYALFDEIITPEEKRTLQEAQNV